MARKRQEILHQLQEEGVLELNKELDMPMLPKRIAVISSPTAAGYGDFSNQLANNQGGFYFHTELFPAIMQGDGVEQSILQALDIIYAREEEFDVVVIIRGGGATSDLTGFDTYPLAAAVAQFPLPIITGIGHERDDTVLDMVSHTRVKTPTAAAEFLIDRIQEVADELTDLSQRLYHGAVEGSAKEAIIARLRKNFEEHENCLQTGFLGTSILMQTLTDNGMGDIAYELLFQRKNPSWLYSVDNGATTIWERWNSYMIDKGMGPQGMNSFNHYAYGAVCAWVWETVAGIAADTENPGFRHIIMRPLPDKRLGHVDAQYQSAAGLIRSAWRYEGNQWIWEFTVPQGATATVTLPGETESKEYEAGTYTVTK